MAVIDIGSEAINRSLYIGCVTSTRVDRNVSANASGKITEIQIWVNQAMTGVEVAIFYIVSGNNLSTRDSVAIGDVATGYQTFPVSLNVVEGDYIGIHTTAGRIDYDGGTSTGWFYMSGDQIPCDNAAFSASVDKRISLSGTGATEEEEANAIFMGCNF